MCLLTAPIVVKSNFWARIYVIFLKQALKKPQWNFHTKFRPHWKDRKRRYQVRQFSALFWYLIALTLGLNNGRSLGLTKTLQETTFRVIWDKLKAKKCFQKQTFTKYLRLNLFIMWNSAPREQLNFCFSRVFWQYK